MQQPELGIGNAKVGLDRADQQRHDLPVDEGEYIGDHAQDHRDPGAPVRQVMIDHAGSLLR